MHANGGQGKPQKVDPTLTLESLRDPSLVVVQRWDNSAVEIKIVSLKDHHHTVKIYKNLGSLLKNDGLDMMEPQIKHPSVDDNVACFTDAQCEYLHVVTKQSCVSPSSELKPKCGIIRYLTLSALALHHIHTKQRLFVGVLTHD